MNNVIRISKLIRPFKKTIFIDGDKSLSIRWALLASQANGKSRSVNLLKSEDVLNTLSCLKQLGIKTKISKNYCEIIGNAEKQNEGTNTSNSNVNTSIFRMKQALKSPRIGISSMVTMNN